MTHGSSALTPEEQEWWVEHYGIRYHHVQANADIPSRHHRRAVKRAVRMRNDGRMVDADASMRRGR